MLFIHYFFWYQNQMFYSTWACENKLETNCEPQYEYRLAIKTTIYMCVFVSIYINILYHTVLVL